MALRTGAPSDLDRRTLYAVLAERLDEELRRIHIGWCLNQTRVDTPHTAAATPVEAPAAQPLTAFLEEGLGGLERAVLQLELGAGRDTHTVRAALRLGPRQYGRHRELGLAKLRGAITGGLKGRVCEQHLGAVTLAATGDRAAADALASGPSRCRSCAREAAGLKRVLQQRLALAPWPFVIKPAGILVAKLGALGAVFGSKSAAGGLGGIGAASSAGSGAKVVAALVATAAVATGGIAAVESDDPVQTSTPAAAVKKAVAPLPAAAVPAAGQATNTASLQERTSTTSKRRATKRGKATAQRQTASTQTQTASAAPAASTQAPSTTSSTGTPAASQSKPLEPVRQTVDTVKKTVDQVKSKLPVKTPPVVDQVTEGLDKTVDDVTSGVESLLTP